MLESHVMYSHEYDETNTSCSKPKGNYNNTCARFGRLISEYEME